MDGEQKMNNISFNLRNLRKQKNKKQKEISVILNITQPEYSRFESGEREPKADVLIKLAQYYNVTLDELIR